LVSRHSIDNRRNALCSLTLDNNYNNDDDDDDDDDDNNDSNDSNQVKKCTQLRKLQLSYTYSY